MKHLIISILLFFILQPLSSAEPPKHEIRAVWLTTIYGLDWPKRVASGTESRLVQQRELCQLLDQLQDAHFNTVFLQVRLRGDVIWNSKIEPAAKIFSGKTGVMPGYDPLTFVVEECHKRGMECHAWFVTFPLGTDKNVRDQGKNSVVKKHPELCKQHRGEWYLDPGVPGTSDYILSLVRELVTGYDIDGIHFDYIRYPEQAKSFPDKTTFRKYGSKAPLAEWRRANITRMVDRIYDWVKSVKPWVQVSSSPLGKYNRIPRVPNAGWTAYESVHQDPKVWMEAGKHDMVVPMMYYLNNNFYPFVDNWVENSNGRMIVPGLGAYRMLKEESDWDVKEIVDQIDYTRANGGAGCTFFRAANVLDNLKGLYDILKTNYYQYPAQLPPLTWLNDSIPVAPSQVDVEQLHDELRISWPAVSASSADQTYTVYATTNDSLNLNQPKYMLMTGIRDTCIYLPVDTTREKGYTFTVTTSSRYHIESEPARETFYFLTPFVK